MKVKLNSNKSNYKDKNYIISIQEQSIMKQWDMIQPIINIIPKKKSDKNEAIF